MKDGIIMRDLCHSDDGSDEDDAVVVDEDDRDCWDHDALLKKRESCQVGGCIDQRVECKVRDRDPHRDVVEAAGL